MSVSAQSVLTNTAIATCGRVINSALGLLVTWLITHALGEAGFGTYALVVSYASILQIATDAGLYLTLSRVISESPEREREYISHTVWLRVVLCLLIFLLGAGGLYLIPNRSTLFIPFIFIAIGFTFQSISQLLMSVYQRYGVVWRITAGDLIGRGAHIAALLIFMMDQLSLTKIMVAFMIGTAVALIAHYMWVPVKYLLSRSFQIKTYREIIQTSWPLGLMLILNAIYFRIDTIILSFFRSDVEVGLYGLAYRIIESSLFFPAMFGGLILPRITAALAEKNIQKAGQWFEEAARFMLLVVVPMAVVLIMLGKSLLVLFGAGFAPAGAFLAILSLAMVSMFVGNMCGFTLVALGKGKALLTLYGVLVVVNIILNIIFIPVYGAYAAAWITVLTEIISLSVAAFIIKRNIQWHILAIPWVRLSVATLATICTVLVVPDMWHVGFKVCIVAVVYLGSLLWLKLLQPSTVQLLLQRT